MSQTTFTFYSGINSIGGVIAEVRHGKHRVIFEMGAAYDPKADFYGGGVRQRTQSWLRDGLRLGLIPKIDGLYPAAAIEGVEGIVSAEDSDVSTIVFITHLHLDHMGYMGAVHPDIPVYLSENAQRIEAALEDTGDGVRTFRNEYTHFTPGEPIQFGEIELLPILSYPMAYGHSSCLLTTPDGTVHWTGDLVMHRPEELPNRLKEIEFLKERGVDVMICDCCEFMDEELVAASSDEQGNIIPTLERPAGWASDEEQAAGMASVVRNVTGLAVFNYYQREMEIARMMEGLAKDNDRTIVFEPDAAWIVYRYYGEAPHVFVPDSDRYARPEILPWFEELMSVATVVTRDDIRAAPNRYLLQMSHPNLLELLDLPNEGGAFLHLFGIPIGDFDPEYARMLDMVDRAGFTFVDVGESMPAGHSAPGAVRYYVDAIAPKILIPAHSFRPDLLEAAPGGIRMFPDLGRSYVLSGGTLTPTE